jgi:DNA-binding transcriptional LysR family regulator
LSSGRRCVSQPAFSRRIQTLETWVGAKLFDRSVQSVELTNAGEVFKPVALEIVQLAYQSRNNIYTQISSDVGKIRFSTVSTLAQFFVPHWLKELRPLVETGSLSVRTDFGGVSDYLDALEDGEVDFFVCYEDPSGTIANYTEKFDSILLGTESLVPVSSADNNGKPNWWFPSCKPGSSIPFLHTHVRPSLWPVRHLLENRFGDLKFVPVYESSIATAVSAMVIEGYGVAWVPRSIVADDLDTGRLVRAADESAEIPLDIKIYRYEPNFEPGTEKFWQALLSEGLD